MTDLSRSLDNMSADRQAALDAIVESARPLAVSRSSVAGQGMPMKQAAG